MEKKSLHSLPDYVPAKGEKELAKDPSRGVLNERGTTHGDYVQDATIAISTLELWMKTPNWERLQPHKKHSLIMNAVKIARILAGDDDHFDHWRDIAGYAKLVEERCPKQKI